MDDPDAESQGDDSSLDEGHVDSQVLDEGVRQSVEELQDLLPQGTDEKSMDVTMNEGEILPEEEESVHDVFEEPVQLDDASQIESQEQELATQDAEEGLQIQEDVIDDGTSLFIPEERAPTVSRSPSPPPKMQPLKMQPPPRPAPMPTGGLPSQSTSRPPNSTFAKIRDMQQKLQRSKNAASKPHYPYQSTLDDEAYLRAAQSFGGARRQVSERPETTDSYEKDDKKAVALFQQQKRKYDQLKFDNGKLNFREEIEWMRIRGAEQSRKEKRKRDLQKAKEDEDLELFPDSPGPRTNHGEDESSEEENAADSGIDLSGHMRKRRLDMPRKPEKQVSMQEAELQSMRVALDAEPDLPKKKRKGSEASQEPSSAVSSTRSSRGKPKGSKTKTRAKTTASTSTKRPRQSLKQKRATEAAVRQATSLFGADVFRQQASQDAPDEPTFRARNKQDALKEIIASVPSDSFKTSVRGDAAALMQATKDFDGHGRVKADGNGMWLVKGMRTSLKAYQVMGSAFMRRRENAQEEPRGGLLADQMGLGKTLMMLANIVNGHPGKHATCKSTLLVASQALISQWSKEIDLHTNGGLTVMKYSSGSRIDSNVAKQILESHDIILTTYTEIMKSYPKNDPPITCQTTEEKLQWWEETYAKERGALHRMMFHRVVLDEAQAIKNHTSRTSIACRAIMAKHRWALSGTPILNALTELYPYFKFLGVPHTGSFKIFKHNYCDGGDSENQERLLVRLSVFMMRRTHSDIFFGAPILKLPPAGQHTHWCVFNPVERAIYEIVRQRFAKHINMWSRTGELAKSYSNALVMLLRLRQLTAHVLLLQHVMEDLLEREDIEAIRHIVKDAAADTSTQRGRTIIAIRKQLEDFAVKASKKHNKMSNSSLFVPQEDDSEMAEDDEHDEQDQTLDDEDGNNFRSERKATGAQFGKDYNFKPYLNSLATGDGWEQKKQQSQCGSCSRSPPHDPWATSCGHLLCAECYEEAEVTAAEHGRPNATCNGCGQVFAHARHLSLEEQSDMTELGPQTRAKRQRNDKKREKIEQQDIAEEWLSLGGEGVLPSAKTIAIKAQLMNWFDKKDDAKPQKVIIYTQFLAMIRILAKVCQEEGWQTEQYHGKMSFTARDKAIEHFAKNPNVRVLLASLRCGGLGLNLTAASRVIMVDPWWNSAAEQQAFCRVFRFGQQETTFLTKFCVRNTVDERLIQMQEKKQKEIDEVMEDKNKTAGKMNIRDLMRLFGNLQEDSEGQPFIVVDNPDPAGGFRADRYDEGYADED